MRLEFDLQGAERKALVKTIEEITGITATYLKAPSFSYKVGDIIIDKTGTVETNDDSLATQLEQKGFYTIPSDEEVEICISIPQNKVNIDNLDALLGAKGKLIARALGVDSLEYEIGAYEVSFPWFKGLEPEEVQVYTRFISAICEMTIKHKRITTKERDVTNEKYAFRCFLLRLSFIGDEYKTDRKILLSKLTGSAAFKNGARK